MITSMYSSLLRATEALPTFQCSGYVQPTLSSPPLGQNECLHLAGWTVCGSQASLSSIRQFGSARPGVIARAPPSAVFLPLTLARVKLLQDRLLEQAWRRQSPSQRRGRQLVVTFSPTQLRQSISFVPQPLLLTAVFKQQCWDPSCSPQNSPGCLATPNLKAAASPGQPPLQPPPHQQPFPQYRLNLNSLFPPNLDFRAPPGLPAKVKILSRVLLTFQDSLPGGPAPPPHKHGCVSQVITHTFLSASGSFFPTMLCFPSQDNVHLFSGPS